MLSANNYWPQPEEDMNNRPKIYSKVHPFRNLYEWKSMKEFVEMLAQNIVYNDSNLIAISKPWGVGIHKPEVMITNKNSHLLLGVYSGCAKYCVNDSLELLSQLLNVKKLKCVKTIDRFMSGIILLVTNESTEKKVIKAINRCKPMEIPFMKFWCITKGWPVINAPFLRERVGIKLLEIDELGEHKESIIIPSEQLTNSMRRRQKPQSDGLIVKTVLSEMRTIEINKSLSTALVELSTTSLKWNFIPCYLANRATFVLGINY
jgi:23S rRNA-/tRNA-specific pseudouridylate synthase